ncbi:MAG: LemA family protein [Propionibacteriaceae bacterium]
MNGFLMFFIILLIVVVLLGVAAVSIYNSLVRSRNLIQESWRQVDVELNRRYDLIPNLVETVRGFAAHERNTLEDVTRLRTQAQQLSTGSGGAPTAERSAVEEQLSASVRQLIVSVEAYPDLKSNANFQALQAQLADTEDRIAAGRRYYNANVGAYNTKVESFPSNIAAGMFNFQKATYFEASDPAVRQAPTVSFGSISDRGDPRPPQRVAEPTNAELNPAPNALPNPQGYQGGASSAQAPGTFADPQPLPGTYNQLPSAPAAHELAIDPVTGIARPNSPEIRP